MIALAAVIASLERSEAEVRPGMMRVMGVLMASATEESKALIGYEHPGWAPLAERTVEEKTRLGYVGRISATDPLYRSGALKDSIGSAVMTDGALIIGEIGSDLPYAATQEHGSSRVPARPFLSPPIMTVELEAQEALGALAVDLLTP